MQETHTGTSTAIQAETPGPAAEGARRRGSRGLVTVAVCLLLPALIAVVVPFLNVNRYQRRIVASLAESLGRPVHLDRISLTLLPLPGLTIENLVVGEDAAFGAEPFIRAASVRATLRISSLWRRRVEFTRIGFTDPSINLVKVAGRWNLETILLQAARIDAAPTAQTAAGPAPRFPYIEVSGARLNLKLGLEKTPFSLTEADCALWLDTPGRWRLRLEGRPMRTDTSVSETGALEVEGTLGRAATLNAVPVDLKATWRNVPLGEASRFVLARDAGLRGYMTVAVTAKGTIGAGPLSMGLHLTNLRRADFMPARTLTVDAGCTAIQTSSFHGLAEVRCSWPPPTDSGPRALALTGTLADVRQPATFAVQAGSPGIAAATLLDWLRIASPRVDPKVQAAGTVSGTIQAEPVTADWRGQLTWSDAALQVPTVSPEPLFTGDISVRAMPSANGSFVLAPLGLDLGGGEFATFDARFGRAGYSLHLTGTASAAKLLALGRALPLLGDGLAEEIPAGGDLHPKGGEPDARLDAKPMRFDLISVRTWGGGREWHPVLHAATRSRRRR